MLGRVPRTARSSSSENPGRTSPPSSRLRCVEHGRPLHRECTRSTVRARDRLPRSTARPASKYSPRLRSISGTRVRLAQDFDDEVGSERRDRLLRDLAIRETVPRGKRHVGNPDQTGEESNHSVRSRDQAEVSGIDEVASGSRSRRTQGAIPDIPCLSPPGRRRPVRRGCCTSARPRDVGLGREPGRRIHADRDKRDIPESFDEVLERSSGLTASRWPSSSVLHGTYRNSLLLSNASAKSTQAAASAAMPASHRSASAWRSFRNVGLSFRNDRARSISRLGSRARTIW